MALPHADPSEREERLAEALVACLKALDQGQALGRQELLARYPEFGPELARFFAGQEQLERWAAPLREAAQAARAKTVGCAREPTVGREPDGGAGRRAGAPPQRFGDYELLEEIGQGGNGVVYRAQQVSLNR